MGESEPSCGGEETGEFLHFLSVFNTLWSEKSWSLPQRAGFQLHLMSVALKQISFSKMQVGAGGGDH